MLQFEEAVEKVKKLLQRPTDSELLEIYGFYKQATVGDCNTEKPGILDPKGRSKWEQWNNKKGMTQEQASKSYIDCVEKLIKKYGLKV